jgi:hypothetical protein
MKFSSTVTLALVLAAGMAAAAAAQTTPGAANEPKSSVSSEPKASVIKPQAGPVQSQPGLKDNKAMDNKGASNAQMKSEEPKAKSAEMKATQPRAKRIAHLKAAHLKRSVQMKAPQRFAQMKATHRVAHLRGAGMQGQNFAQARQNLSPDQVKAAQEQLRSAGLYNGPTDGMMDPDTRAALARFQQQNGLRSTQTLDQQTLARLNAGQTSSFGSSAPTGNQGTAAPPSAGGNTSGQINR